MNDIQFGKFVGPDKVMCRFKWDYPIVNLMSGHIRGCCRTPKQKLTAQDLETYGKDAIMNLPYEKERRLEKIKGITHSDCSGCLRLEATGMPAPRTGTKSFLRDYWVPKRAPADGKFLHRIGYFELLTENVDINHPMLRSDHPDMLEIVMGNFCDLKCTYCSHFYSNQWAHELIKHGDLKQEDYDRDFPQAPEKLQDVFWEWFYDVGRHSVRTINILGGEPTFMPQFYILMDKLIAAFEDLPKKRSETVELGIITNMNTSPGNLQKILKAIPELVKHFHLHIQPSMEATGSRAEYVRFNLSWSRFESNIKTILKLVNDSQIGQEQFRLSFQMALNTFSISSLPGFLEWVDSLKSEFNFPAGLMQNVVSSPRHHDPTILTPDFAEYIQKAIKFVAPRAEAYDLARKDEKKFGDWRSYQKFLLEPMLESLKNPERSQFHLDSRDHFYEFVKKNDQRRGCDFLKTFPEYADFWALCERAYHEKRPSNPPSDSLAPTSQS